MALLLVFKLMLKISSYDLRIIKILIELFISFNDLIRDCYLCPLHGLLRINNFNTRLAQEKFDINVTNLNH